jgi:hypothetical protein
MRGGLKAGAKMSGGRLVRGDSSYAPTLVQLLEAAIDNVSPDRREKYRAWLKASINPRVSEKKRQALKAAVEATNKVGDDARLIPLIEHLQSEVRKAIEAAHTEQREGAGAMRSRRFQEMNVTAAQKEIFSRLRPLLNDHDVSLAEVKDVISAVVKEHIDRYAAKKGIQPLSDEARKTVSPARAQYLDQQSGEFQESKDAFNDMVAQSIWQAIGAAESWGENDVEFWSESKSAASDRLQAEAGTTSDQEGQPTKRTKRAGQGSEDLGTDEQVNAGRLDENGDVVDHFTDGEPSVQFNANDIDRGLKSRESDADAFITLRPAKHGISKFATSGKMNLGELLGEPPGAKSVQSDIMRELQKFVGRNGEKILSPEFGVTISAHPDGSVTIRFTAINNAAPPVSRAQTLGRWISSNPNLSKIISNAKPVSSAEAGKVGLDPSERIKGIAINVGSSSNPVWVQSVSFANQGVGALGAETDQERADRIDKMKQSMMDRTIADRTRMLRNEGKTHGALSAAVKKMKAEVKAQYAREEAYRARRSVDTRGGPAITTDDIKNAPVGGLMAFSPNQFGLNYTKKTADGVFQLIKERMAAFRQADIEAKRKERPAWQYEIQALRELDTQGDGVNKPEAFLYELFAGLSPAAAIKRLQSIGRLGEYEAFKSITQNNIAYRNANMGESAGFEEQMRKFLGIVPRTTEEAARDFAVKEEAASTRLASDAQSSAATAWANAPAGTRSSQNALNTLNSLDSIRRQEEFRRKADALAESRMPKLPAKPPMLPGEALEVYQQRLAEFDKLKEERKRLQTAAGAVGRTFRNVGEAVSEIGKAMNAIGVRMHGHTQKGSYEDGEVIARGVGANGRMVVVRNGVGHPELGSVYVGENGDVNVMVDTQRGTITTPRHEMVRHLGIMSLSDAEFKALAGHLGVATERTLKNEEAMVVALDERQVNPPGWARRIWDKIMRGMAAVYDAFSGKDPNGRPPRGRDIVDQIESGMMAQRGMESGSIDSQAGVKRLQSGPDNTARARRYDEIVSTPERAAAEVLQGAETYEDTPTEGGSRITHNPFTRTMHWISTQTGKVGEYLRSAMNSFDALDAFAPKISSHLRYLHTEATEEEGRINEYARNEIKRVFIKDQHKQTMFVRDADGNPHELTKGIFATAYMVAQEALENESGPVAKTLADSGMTTEISRPAEGKKAVGYMKFRNPAALRAFVAQAPADVVELAHNMRALADKLGDDVRKVFPDFNKRQWYTTLVRDMITRPSTGEKVNIETAKTKYLINAVTASMMKDVEGSSKNPFIVRDVVDMMVDHARVASRLAGWGRVHKFYDDVLNTETFHRAMRARIKDKQVADSVLKKFRDEQDTMGGVVDMDDSNTIGKKIVQTYGTSFLFAPHQMVTQFPSVWALMSRTDIPLKIRLKHSALKPLMSMADRAYARQMYEQMWTIRQRARPESMHGSMLGAGDIGGGGVFYAKNNPFIWRDRMTSKILMQADRPTMYRIIAMARDTLIHEGHDQNAPDFVDKMRTLTADLVNDTQSATSTGNKVPLARNPSFHAKVVNFFYNQLAKTFSKMMKVNLKMHTARNKAERIAALKEFAANFVWYNLLQNAHYIGAKTAFFGVTSAAAASGLAMLGIGTDGGDDEEEEQKQSATNAFIKDLAVKVFEPIPGMRIASGLTRLAVTKASGKPAPEYQVASAYGPHPIYQVASDVVDTLGYGAGAIHRKFDLKFRDDMTDEELAKYTRQADTMMRKAQEAIINTGGETFGLPTFYITGVMRDQRRRQRNIAKRGGYEE